MREAWVELVIASVIVSTIVAFFSIALVSANT
jgi:hypothetical protein